MKYVIKKIRPSYWVVFCPSGFIKTEFSFSDAIEYMNYDNMSYLFKAS